MASIVETRLKIPIGNISEVHGLSPIVRKHSDKISTVPIPLSTIQNASSSGQRNLMSASHSVSSTTQLMTSDNMTSEKLVTRDVVLLTVYTCTLLLLSLLSNGTICCVFYNKPQLLTVSNYFVLNLACCELGLSLLVLPFSVVSVARGQWPLGDAWCRSQGFVLVVLLVALHYTLLAISLDRNFAIVNSLRYPYVFTHSLGCSIVAGTWILGLAVGLPPLFGWGSFRYDKQQLLCSVDWRDDPSYTHFFIILVFILPVLVQICCYLSIFRAALGHTKRSSKVFPSSATTTTSTTATTTNNITATSTISSTATSSSTATASSSGDCASPDNVVQEAPPAGRGGSRTTECKAVKTIVIIAAAYFTCWTLYALVAMLRGWGEHVHPSTDMAAAALTFMSCILNPIIYGFMNRVIRYEICKLWNRAINHLSGRPAPQFVQNDDDGISSTWAISLSSTRHSASGGASGTSAHAQRPPRASKSATGAVRNMEMVTIREEPEMDEKEGP